MRGTLHRITVAHARWRQVLSAVLVLIGGTGCGHTEPVSVATVTVVASTTSVIVGNTISLSASARDASGNVLADRPVTWASGSPSIATVGTTGIVTAVAVGTATITATSEGKPGTVTVTVLPVPVATVSVSPTSASVIVGATQQFAAVTRDVAGNVLIGRAVTWSVNQPQTATISAAGFLSAVSTGTVSVTATSEGQSASAPVTVLPVPVVSIVVAPTSAVLLVGATRALTVTLRDINGTAITRAVAWTSSAPSVATVDAQGTVSAIAPGNVTVTAAIDGVAASAAIVVITGVPPVISTLEPATLLPGGTAVLTGTGFSATVSANSVTVGGVDAPVLTATASQLTVFVPCVESGNALVRVATNGIVSNAVTRTVSVPRRTIAVGQALVLTNNAASLCNELVSTGSAARYLVTAFSAATSQNTLLDFELTGNTPTAAETAPRIDMPRARVGASTTSDEQSRQDAAHFAFLERDRLQYERLRSVVGRTPPPRSAVRADLPALGDMRGLYFTFNTNCGDTTRVMRSKAIHVGSRSIIWEDSANTLQSATNTVLAGYYQRLGQIFDQDQYESVKNNFGDPLPRDAVTDRDGRVHMIFSQRLNGSGAAAYVTSCDQLPTTATATRASNFGQFFYGSVPTTATLNLNSTASPDGWFYFMARTVVHEVKHVTSHSARVANNAPFEQSWLEEGTARHAEEMWVRESLHRVPWKANTGFGSAADNGIYCDFTPTDATCNAADPLRRPSYGMRRQFNEIREKLLEPWNWSPYGDATGQSTSTFYQTTWSLVRYAIDRYATSDAAFFRALVNSSVTGTANLTAVAGVPLDQLIGGWGLALFTDDYPGLVSPSADLQFATWNLRSIYSGLNSLAAWNTRWNTPFPILPVQLRFGSFVSRVSGLRGGSHAYFEIVGAPSAAQLVGLRAVTSGTPSPNLRIAIARLQ